MPSTGQLCSRLIVLLCPLSLSLCVPGHRSLWTGSRLLQRWRIHQVTVFKFVVSNSLHSTSLLDDCTVKSAIRAHWQTFRFPVFSSANKCLLKVATYAAQLEQYLKAIEIYEQVWWSSPQPSSHVTYHHWLQGAPLTKQNASFCDFSGWDPRDGQHAPEIQRQGSLLQGSALSLLCRHAECKGKPLRWIRVCALHEPLIHPNVRPLVTQLAVQKYEEMFPAFSDSRECKLLKVSFAVNVPFKIWGWTLLRWTLPPAHRCFLFDRRLTSLTPTQWSKMKVRSWKMFNTSPRSR